ncbi:MAG TPA: molecular chaperone DjiA [Lutibacter sp.]|nr:molecular chaperone DjiA [Lutibacter sp.]
MSNFSKWIGATLGWSFGGPIGAALGFILGSVVDGVKFEQIEMNPRRTLKKPQTQSGDFEVSLLVLAAIVIKADGKIDQRELDFVRKQFVAMYGKTRADNAFKLFKGIIKEEISTRQISMQIRRNMDHPSRLQLVHFLFNIARADGFVNDLEEDKIRQIASYLGISTRDYASIKAMFYDSSDANYKILEITKTATNIEVKKAYRKMAKKYHPDKVRHLGEEHQKGAEEKFKRIQKAYEGIQAERGL